MNINVTTAPTKLNTSSYADVAERGQALVLQNLGPGDVYFDTRSDVSAETGVKIGVNGGYEVAFGVGISLFVMTDSAEGADLRYTVVG